MNITNPHERAAFIVAYVKCALWSSMDNSDPETGGEPLDANHEPEDIDSDTLNVMRADCNDFMKSNADDLAGIDAGQAGHDFWLTRNGHGAGFWDRGLGDIGDRLTANSKPYGEYTLYVGDDGRIDGQ